MKIVDVGCTSEFNRNYRLKQLRAVTVKVSEKALVKEKEIPLVGFGEGSNSFNGNNRKLFYGWGGNGGGEGGSMIQSIGGGNFGGDGGGTSISSEGGGAGISQGGGEGAGSSGGMGFGNVKGFGEGIGRRYERWWRLN